MSRKPTVFKAIDDLRARYYKALPGKENLMRVLTEAEIPEHVFNSNAIENSTLTLEETEKILLEIELDRFVSPREVFEAKNLARVFDYITKKAKQNELDVELILLLHKMLISNIQNDIAGRFRTAGEYVRVGSYVAPAPEAIDEGIRTILHYYHTSQSEQVISRIARMHLMFEHLHPFVDGNGRIGRVINNYVLQREGFVPMNIAFIDRAEYHRAFRTYDKDNSIKIMEEIVGRALTQSYHKRLAYLEGKKIVSLAEFAKEKKQSLSNLLNKAKRQTIEAFLEKGVWKICSDFEMNHPGLKARGISGFG